MAQAILRTSIYVDGFNLYYRALRRTPYKWLDIEKLCAGLLSTENHITTLRYFTAPVSGKLDPGQPVRQQMYLRALGTLPHCTIHMGSFLASVKVRPLETPQPGGPTHVRVLISEEKGSDVNIATHILNDAWKDHYDVALLLSQDTDLVEPVRIVTQELGKAVGIVCLDGKAPGKLAAHASFVRHITAQRLAAAQFPEEITTSKGKILRRPASWA